MAATAERVVAPDREQISRSGAWLTDLMLLGMALIWGVNFSIVKFGTHTLPPLTYNALRIALSAGVFLLLARRSAAARPSPGDRRALLKLGLVGHGLYQTCFILGLARSRAGTVALVLAAAPALSAILGRIRGSEYLTSRGWLGIGLQLAGVGAVVFGMTTGHGRGDSVLGMVLILAGSICWAFYSVLVKPYTERVDSMQLGAITVLGGAVLVTLVAIPEFLVVPWRAIELPVWGAVAYSGLGAMVLANIFWFRGVRVLGPTHVALFGNLQPMIALAVAWLALGEVPTLWQLVGAGSIMSGLLISRT